MDTDKHGYEGNWLEGFIKEALEKKLCTKIYCTTCAATDFRNGILTFSKSHQSNPSPNQEEIAREIAEKASLINRRRDHNWTEALRFVINETYHALGHERLEAILKNSWAGDELKAMIAHSKRVTDMRLAHERSQSPEFIRKAREEKKAERQKQHTARLERKREKDEQWRQAQKAREDKK